MVMREMWVASVEGECDETGVIEQLWAAETNHDANDDTGPSSQPASGDESSDDASGDVRLAEPAVILDRAATSQLVRSHFSWRATAATPRPRRLSRSSLAVVPRGRPSLSSLVLRSGHLPPGSPFLSLPFIPVSSPHLLSLCPLSPHVLSGSTLPHTSR